MWRKQFRHSTAGIHKNRKDIRGANHVLVRLSPAFARSGETRNRIAR
jgi:hypothetical protein